MTPSTTYLCLLLEPGLHTTCLKTPLKHLFLCIYLHITLYERTHHTLGHDEIYDSTVLISFSSRIIPVYTIATHIIFTIHYARWEQVYQYNKIYI
ncbi:hypothetical protein BDV18DRAFT_2915 [Aspergillus unguis]